ncbi:MAG: hypothetical protein PUP91_16360 [Rhizonema sp. PD37]|nr:hypothetical protein [Rhizonema sp. PD37]
MIAIPQTEFDDDSPRGVTLEWIQSLPPELKDAALYRLCKAIECKPTLVESFTLTQVIYRTISGGTFTESADNVAQRTGCDRKTILKGLSIAKEQNILEENKRPGTSSEYWFKPVEEWLSAPVVRIKDIRTKKIIEFPKIQDTEEVETEQQLASEVCGTEDSIPRASRNDEVVREMDDHQTETNSVVVINKLIKEQQQQVVVPITDTPSIWRSLPSGNRYAQIPPIYDQDTGVEIQRQMDEEGLTAQKVMGRAIAFSKVPLLVLEALASVGNRLLNVCSQTKSELLKDENKPNSEDTEVVVSLQLSKTLTAMGVILTTEQTRHCLTEYGEDAMLDAAVQLRKSGLLESQHDIEGYFLNYLQNSVKGVPVEVKRLSVVAPRKPGMTAIKSITSKEAAPFPTEIMVLLKNAEIHLVPAKAEKLWAAHSEKFVDAIAYVDQKTKEGKVANREGYFVKCLEEGWLVKKTEPEKRNPSCLTLEQQQWYEWACMTGICVNTPVKDLPTLMGVLAVLIPIKDRRQFDPPYDLVAIDTAMREYPMQM